MANGLLDVLGSALGTTPPSYMEGLLGAQATEDLRKRSIGSGIVNALVGYAAMPKNQNLGLGRILAGTAQAGMAGAKGVYDTALQDYQTQAKIDEMARKRQQDLAGQQAINTLLQDPKIANDPMAVAFIKSNPSEALKVYATPKERKTATVGNKVIDTSTGQEIYVGEKELKALPTYTVERGRTKYTYQIQPDGTEKLLGQSSMDAPKEAKAMWSSTPVSTPNGYVYMPTAEGITAGKKPINASTGKPVDEIMTKEQIELADRSKKVVSGQQAQIGNIGAIYNAIGDAKSVLNDPLAFTAGTVGKTASILSMPSRAKLEGSLDTLKANLSFENLKAMRDASPTGGALGSITEGELRLLSSTIASLDPNLPKAQLMKNLNEIESKYSTVFKAIRNDLKSQNINIPAESLPRTMMFNIPSVGKIDAKLSSDGNYYYKDKNGKTYMVKE